MGIAAAYAFGCSVMTPIEPTTANGEATIVSAVHAIM